MKTIIRLMGLMGLMLLALPAGADLVATVQPGYTFAEDELPTTATLNQAAQPTVTISGSISGSTGLTPGSVGGNLLSDTLPDGATLGYNGASPRQLSVKTGGLTNLWDANVSNNAAIQISKLQVYSNSVPIGSITNNGVTMVFGREFTLVSTTNIFPGPVTNLGYTLTLTAAGTALGPNLNSLVVGTMVTAAHGYTNPPALVRWLVQCTNADLGYQPGDEFDAAQLVNSGVQAVLLCGGADATNLWLLPYGQTTYSIPNKTNGVVGSATKTAWRVKSYFRP